MIALQDAEMLTRVEYLEPARFIGTEYFGFVEGFLRDAGIRHIGWHYVIDLAWIYEKIKVLPRGSVILDAGGGRGCAQFMLAELGYNIHNVDLVHIDPSYWIRKRYGTRRVVLPSFSRTSYADFVEGDRGRFNSLAVRRKLRSSNVVRFVRDAVNTHRLRKWANGVGLKIGPGSITWYQGNLADMPELQSSRFDAVVSLSSVEHIPLQVLPGAVAELDRLSKSSAVWAITTSGADGGATWWHEPSQSSCFSASDLTRYFGASVAADADPPGVLAQYRSCEYLAKHLPPRYRLSGNNGMPWGIWDPKYIPVGLWREGALAS